MTFYYMDYDMSNGMSFYEYFSCIHRGGNWFLQVALLQYEWDQQVFQILACFTGHQLSLQVETD